MKNSKQPKNLKIETERLILRTVCLEDAPFIQEYFPHLDIVKYISNVPWPYPENGAKTFLQEKTLSQMEKAEGFTFIIERKEDHQPMGLISYTLEDALMLYQKQELKVAERGFWLGIPFQGQGFMTEAANAANRWFFENTDADAIVAYNLCVNKESSRVKKKQGFELLGVFDVKASFLIECDKEERWILTKENFLSTC